MDNVYIIIFIVIPIAMFGAGFLVARQSRALEGVPLFSMIFVQRRLLFCLIMGFFISLIFTAILGLVDDFTPLLFLSFLGIFLLAAFSYYFGINLGWGKSESFSDTIITTTNQTETEDSFSENLLIENLPASIKITINSEKRWRFFMMEAFQLIFIGSCGLPVLSLMAISFLQNYLPEYMYFLVWILVGGLALYLFYTKFMEALEYIFDKEIVEISNLSVKIEKFGSKFSNKKEYSAENIKKITGIFSAGGIHAGLKRSPFVNSNMPTFMLWHNRGLKRYRAFGRALDLADAQSILEMVYVRFPQYKA